MSVSLCVSVSVCVCTCTCVRVSVSMCMYVCVSVYVCVYVSGNNLLQSQDDMRALVTWLNSKLTDGQLVLTAPVLVSRSLQVQHNTESEK